MRFENEVWSRYHQVHAQAKKEARMAENNGFEKCPRELKNELESVLEPIRNSVNEQRFEAAAAASLHEFAKEVWQTWQTAGVFARRRALRDLRERAGFRLESHRIGNYVAKTYDLANEAQMKFGHAQQLLFAADVTYKCRPCVYHDIYDVLTSSVDDRPSS